MVAQKPAQDVLRVKFSGTIDAFPFANLVHWKFSGGTITTPVIDSLCVAFGTAYTNAFASLMPLSTRLMTVEAWDLTGPAGAFGQSGPNVPGTRAGVLLPANIACVVSFKVNYRWRGGHPRMYLPIGVAADVSDSRHWAAAFAASVDAAALQFRQGMNGANNAAFTGRLVCLRRWNTPVKGQPPVELDPPLALDIVGEEVDTRIDTQRRRLGPDIPA